MPITEHPIFKQPPRDAKLWRYTNFPKFVSLITTKALFFSNVYHLSRDDPYEGALPAGNFAHRDWSIDTLPSDIRQRIQRARYSHDENEPLASKLQRHISGQNELIRHVLRSTKEYFINCWHQSEYESAAMWKLYAEDSFGIAIVSNLSRISGALSSASGDIMCGLVNYIDYEKDLLDLENAFTPIISKRLSFAHEREVRLLHWDTSIGDEQVWMLWNGQPKLMWQPKSHEDHYKIVPPMGNIFACDLDELVLEIKISPTAPAWFEAAVRDFCDLAGFDKPISKSLLMGSPMR
ncbi:MULTISPECIES: DUF2971 domain-containing protein [Rhizobium]|uniref:DUF2971 domain-containing protein n=1 Tax=Rhizobium TaxID=379 RepID=UPI00103CE604|nr:DUF2971 domain-containing protein [Rhizobium leguminosarum]TBZ99374.1 DUF2971 domain-containing protein [Rhizobium leguminosarum bv. viciae]UFW76714.1 DUF2971 domain-containing protein [Rhizobium leguminosarum bv. viciae]